MDIAGRVALVTGAGTGIGRATAVALAQAGAAVVVADIHLAGAQATVDAIIAAGGRASAVRADVSNPDDVRAMFAAAEHTFGGVDIVHNNAGLICGEPVWPDAPLEKIMAVIGVNLGGVAMGTQEGIRALRRRGGGVIVNTASVAALAPMPNDPVYSATKAGVVRITESCAGFAAEGIRVNAVLPGMVDTDMTHKHTGDGTRPARWLEPIIAATPLLSADDIAAAVLELIRDDGAVAVSKVVSNPKR
jgi:NAD(P)-dependent dehydrogenase (short-subunit alcohol dehydrogenase family)